MATYPSFRGDSDGGGDMQEVFKVTVDWTKPVFAVSTTWWLLGLVALTVAVLIGLKLWSNRRNPYEIESFTFEIPLPGGKVSGVLKPDRSQRKAAWELYVELVTRISVVELQQDEGLLREALTSLQSLFDTTRKILRQYGPTVSRPRDGDAASVGYIAVAVLNKGLRPVLARWHPLLSAHESLRPDGLSVYDHEKDWPRYDELRGVLSDLRRGLTEYAKALEKAAGVPSTLIMDRAEH